MSFTWAAISIGLMGSLHCLGMCGPIALALPIGGKSAVQRSVAVLIYNLGRVTTYAMLGAIFGLLGKGFNMAGLQQWVSILCGISILLFLLLPSKLAAPSFSPLYKFSGKVQAGLRKLFASGNRGTMFFIGSLNGLLPCGLVYVAIAGALLTHTVFDGALFMAFFGLGTLPMMMGVNLLKDRISISFRNKARKVVPYFVSVVAILLVLRGLNLGIPYVSPSVEVKEKTMNCCKANTCKK